MVLNDQGWAITAKHIFDEITRAQQSVKVAVGIDTALAELRAQQGGNPKNRNRKIRKLERQKADCLSGRVEIWAAGSEWQQAKPRAVEAHGHAVADLALFRIEPFTPKTDQTYPVLRAEALTPGVAVCRLGFPWHAVEAEFQDNNFDVKSGFPAPLFASDGIVSRFLMEKHPDGGTTTYIQTSTPGLRGQSGGPLFDVQGRLCGLQSSTTHLDLGFDAKYDRGGETVVERQFLNVGQAVHVDEIRAFLDANDISYQTS